MAPKHEGPDAVARVEAGSCVAGRQHGPDNTTATLAPTGLTWSPQQLEAIERIATWLDRGDRPSFYLAGFAGTGKTTLLRYLAECAGDVVLYGAYTGKAASVMRRKGCADATTVDQLIYHHPFIWQCRGECRKPPCAELCVHAWQLWLGRRLNPKSAMAGADLGVIDECSMLPLVMWDDLLSFEQPVLVVGDPGQLPPVEGAGFLAGREPDAFLTEIHRQAEDDPIIHLATLARQGRRLPLGRLGASEVTRQMPRDLASYDAVICGRNVTRHQLNRLIRTQLGFRGALPQRGERLVILRNRHKAGLMNGEIVTVLDVGVENDGFLPMTVAAEGRLPVAIEAPLEPLTGDDTDAASMQGDPVTWGYALTAHKAQGSQWNDILVVDESWCFREMASRWLYTAVTRAVERVTIARAQP